MPDFFKTVSDRAPIYGMNSRDDPKDLDDGEVVELVNAEPGNPPVPRKGMRHWKIPDTTDYEWASHCVAFKTTGGTTYIVGWVKDGTNYLLIKVNHATKAKTLLGTATDLTDPAFSLIRVFDYIYSIVDEDMHWKNSGFTSRHKIIELLDTGDVVREMCIDVSAAVLSVSFATGTYLVQGYVGYAFTFIRHIASDAFDSNDVPQILTTFTPGVNESYENSTKRLVIGSDTVAIDPTVNLITSATDTTYEQAKEFGATHIRVFRTRVKTTEALATAALAALEGYFLVDLPIPSYMPPRDIADIELNSNDYKMTSAGHGVTAGTAMFFGFDNAELDFQAWPITIDDVDTIQLTGSWVKTWAAYSGSGGYFTKNYFNIDVFSGTTVSAITLTGTKILIRTATAHGLSPTDVIYIDGITGGDGDTDGEQYIYAQYLWSTGWWENLYKQCAAWTGLNGSTYVVDSVVDSTSFYLTALSADYLKPYIPATDAEIVELELLHGTARAYTYSDADKTPVMTGGGFIGAGLKAVTAVSAPENEVVVETTEAHNLSDNHYVKLDDLTDGATELDNYSGIIEVIDTTRFRLVDKSTSGISPWVSGGVIYPSTTPLSWADTVTDDDLSGELASMVTTAYSAGPKAGFVEYALNRMWLFGLLTTEKGRAYYTEIIGGAGGTPLNDAVAYPQKYASMFKYNYFIDFSVQKGHEPTGIKRLGSDLYFFFEGEIYALYTSNPLQATPSLVNGEIGCAFPETLKVCEIPKYGGQCLLFLSNLGPAITRLGGATALFTDFKIAQLWPKSNRELYDDLETNAGKEHIIHNCSAVFFKNRYIITYKTNAGVNKIFAYYFNPRTLDDPKAPHGPYQIELEEVS